MNCNFGVQMRIALAAKYFAATQGLKPKCRFYTETKAALPKFSI